MDNIYGIVTGVNGNLVSVKIDGSVKKNEVGFVLLGDSTITKLFDILITFSL